MNVYYYECRPRKPRYYYEFIIMNCYECLLLWMSSQEAQVDPLADDKFSVQKRPSIRSVVVQKKPSIPWQT
jgi:hypothetical protein